VPLGDAERVKAGRESPEGGITPKLLILLDDFEQNGHCERRGVMRNASLTTAHQEAARHGRRVRQSQKAAQAAATVDTLLADAGQLPAYAVAHAAKARTGNTRSLIALKCLDCCCWEKTEVANCPVTCCPLFPLRPYQK
jgi:hypothetical protein